MPSENERPSPVLTPDSESRARVLLVSLRALEQKTFRCGTYEFEDVIAGVDSVDVRCWQWEDPNAGRRFRQRLARKWGRVYRNLDQPFIGARMLRVEQRTFNVTGPTSRCSVTLTLFS